MEQGTERITLLNTMVDVLTMEETVRLVEQYVIKKKPLHLMGVNADKINMLNGNVRLKEIVNGCDVITADGASVVLASRFLGMPLPERIAGIDLMQRLVEMGSRNGYTVYLLGARQEVVEKTAQVLTDRYQNLKVAGIRNGYFTQDQWGNIADELQRKLPDMVFVGITSPLKEYFIDYLQKRGVSSVFMGVGGSFDVISGSIPRAPIWMQQMNMEWLFRVMQEPRRLFRRYFIGNFKFIKAVIKEKEK